MSSILPSKPACTNHEDTMAQVLCKADRVFLCTECLINKEHNGCELTEISKMKSRSDNMLIELLLLRQVAENKLSDRENVEELVEGEKERVGTEMDQKCQKLKDMIDQIKEDSKAEMQTDFDKQLERAQREVKSLKKLQSSIETQIEKLSGDAAEGMNINQVEYHKVSEKIYTSRSSLSRITDRDYACFGRFEMAPNLREIETGKRRSFGKATLLFRSMPRNQQSWHH